MDLGAGQDVIAPHQRIAGTGRLSGGRNFLLLEVRLLFALRLGLFALLIGWRRRPVHLLRRIVAICIHDAEIVLRMLIVVLCGDPITRRHSFPRKGHIAFKDLIRVAPNLGPRTIAIEGL